MRRWIRLKNGNRNEKMGMGIEMEMELEMGFWAVRNRWKAIYITFSLIAADRLAALNLSAANQHQHAARVNLRSQHLVFG